MQSAAIGRKEPKTTLSTHFPNVHLLKLLSRLNLQCKFRKTLLFGVGVRGVRYLQATDITRFQTPSLFKGKLKK